MSTKQVHSLITQQAFGYVLLATMLAIISGCVATETSNLRPYGQGTSVTRLKDGREGFIIRETPKMSGELRKEFERASH